MNRWLALIPLAVLAALAALFVGWSLKRDPAFKPDALVGQTIPETVLPLLSGDQAGPGNLDLKTAGVGRPMLVNVFASWCAPCREENGQLLQVQARGVRVVGLAWKDRPENSRAFLAELGNPFAVVVSDQEGASGVDLGISGVPETFAVDAMGRITANQSGPLLDDADIDRLVASMQAPPSPAPTKR